MPFLEQSHLRVHYLWDGPEERPVLLLSHSLGATLSLWDPQIPDFASHFRVLRYDTRGHGQSSVPPGPYNFDQIGSDVLGLLDGLGIESAFFCGLSMGGVVGQWLGIHAPGRLKKLVLCSTAAKIGNAETWNSRIDTVLNQGVSAIAPIQVARWFTPEFQANAPEAIARASQLLESADPAGYAACCAALRDMDFREAINNITTPTLAVAGLHDPVTPPADLKYLVEHIPAAQYAELPASHLSNIEASEQFNRTVLRFLLE
jgi:3-oxoadipate enol-lactonase